MSILPSPKIRTLTLPRLTNALAFVHLAENTKRVSDLAGVLRNAPGRVVFLGNSITEYGDWKKLLNDTTVINRGIAADNTFGVLERLEDVIALQPKRLFIEIGINDIAQNIPTEIIVRNILSIVERVTMRSPVTKIYVLSILPTNDNVKKNIRTPLIKTLK